MKSGHVLLNPLGVDDSPDPDHLMSTPTADIPAGSQDGLLLSDCVGASHEAREELSAFVTAGVANDSSPQLEGRRASSAPACGGSGRDRVLGAEHGLALPSMSIREEAEHEPVLFRNALTLDKKTARFRIRKPRCRRLVKAVRAVRIRRKWSICRDFDAPGRIRTCDPRIRSPPLCPLSYGRALQSSVLTKRRSSGGWRV